MARNSKAGRHEFVIGKHETPVRNAREAADKANDLQGRLRQFGHYSRATKKGREWPSDQSTVRPR